MNRRALLRAVASAPVLAAAGSAAANPLSARYARAEQYLAWNRPQLLHNGPPHTEWFGADQLWCRLDGPRDERRFLRFDARTGAEAPAFNHERIAAGLSAAGLRARPEAPPFETFTYEDSESAIGFDADRRRWRCDLTTGVCTARDVDPAPQGIPSPDGRWVVYGRDHNLWVRDVTSGAERALTQDGVPHFAYGARSGNNTEAISERLGPPRPPLLVWSPDSQRIITHRLDERRVQAMHLIESAPRSGGPRPKLHSYRYSLALETERPQEHLVVIDVADGAQRAVAQPPIETIHQTAFEERYVWWSRDARHAFVVVRGPFAKVLTLRRIDPASGAVTDLITERSDTFAEIAEGGQLPRVRDLRNGDLIWFSERSGYGHLYLYDRQGRLLRALTAGEWNVLDILRVDEAGGWIYLYGLGREPGRPGQRRVYRVKLDGSPPRLLTPAAMDHEVRITPKFPFEFARGAGFEAASPQDGISPSNRYFVEIASDLTSPPVTFLRRADGTLIRRIAAADVSALRPVAPKPEPIEVLAADGVTRLYGALFKPSDFDPLQRYPVVDSLYPGPQMARVSEDYGGAIFDFFEAQSIAELGFVVLALDGRGTPHRSKAFLAQSYGRLGDAGGLADHVAALKALAAARPYMDLSRVGAIGHSGGGFAAARAILAYPDVFKVAVASAGNHHQRLYVSGWGEVYNGPESGQNYAEADNAALAANLRGRLLLVHGELDDNVSPAQTLRLADALVAANKDFDLLILPGANHNLLAAGRPNPISAYFVRRRWDYLVRHLRNEIPPPYAVKGQ